MKLTLFFSFFQWPAKMYRIDNVANIPESLETFGLYEGNKFVLVATKLLLLKL